MKGKEEAGGVAGGSRGRGFECLLRPRGFCPGASMTEGKASATRMRESRRAGERGEGMAGKREMKSSNSRA